MSGGEAAAELLVGVGNLSLKMGIALCQTFGNDVIDEAVTFFLQLVTEQVATETKGQGILILRDGQNHEVNCFIVEGRVCLGRKIRTCGFDATDYGRRAL